MIKTSTSTLTIADSHRLLREKQISPTELVSLFIDQIDKVDPQVKAWVRVEKAQAVERAKALEMKMKDPDELPPLFAIPYGAKDIMYTKGIPTEGGSLVNKGFIPDRNAKVIEKLQNSGAILLGKTTTTEFANWGGPPETRNPWNLNHTPGGSSSGSAAAVAGGMAMLSLGTQTAGSLSRPAAYNGLTVLKATYGRISKAGVIPASWSLDHIGAFTRTVEDTVLVYNEISGPDPDDSATWTLPKQNLRIQEQRGYTVGVVIDDYFQDTDAEVKRTMEEAIREFERMGFTITYIRLPDSLEAANAAHHIVMKSEVAHFHEEEFLKDASRFGFFLQEFIRDGLQIKANDYLKAQRIRTVFRQEVSDLFKQVDLLLTAATPTPAPEGILATGSPAFNLPFTNAGVPTLTLPAGYTKNSNLPMAIQLIAAPLEEQKLIDAGYLFQKQTDWHLNIPEILK
ncbi:amidase [Mesobacillus foraminis]|uniref:Amidase/aspartyl-tRNA(Asn)/glutamyl-tRNA(Gln) amidotransferase subunit A n=1 Tax=Mesobacillus foraminis TaxID=279826 RepID=A0A4R2B6U4_9BACI|nr:amidase [Mesobacillus foraminis]TCN21144.1 amidase/aspartyl-tRNA(Asn)/glutamyl-tRNA(Gln) amidotransferase subunit A [Mesobacillus foraminis]